MSVTQITGNMVINDVIKKYPETISVFNSFRVDSCCGGGQSIAKTAAADGIAMDALLSALNEAAGSSVAEKG